MKKKISIVLLVVILASLSGCGFGRVSECRKRYIGCRWNCELEYGWTGYHGSKYEVAKVLGNSYRGYAETDGILLAERAADDVWDYRVLNGKTYGEKRVKYLPSTMKLLLLPR